MATAPMFCRVCRGHEVCAVGCFTPDRESVVSLVLVDDGGSGQIAAFQNTLRQHAGRQP